LSERGKLRTILYGKKLIYAAPKNVKGQVLDEFYGLSKVVHGLACTEGLVRFYRSRMDGVVVAERFFYGLGAVPEWGLLYPEGKMLLFEYCTKSNFLFSGKVKGKIQAYDRSLDKIEKKFNTKAMIVFVLDVPKGVVERFVVRERQAGTENGAAGKIFFTDYETFRKIPIGEQLTAPIYFWNDGKQYPLRQNV
jgi:hypothetical protein